MNLRWSFDVESRRSFTLGIYDLRTCVHLFRYETSEVGGREGTRLNFRHGKAVS